MPTENFEDYDKYIVVTMIVCFIIATSLLILRECIDTIRGNPSENNNTELINV